MQIELQSRSRRILCALVFASATLLYSGQVIRDYLASRLADRPNPTSLAKAVKLQPWNAESRWVQGRSSLFITQNTSSAVADYEAAVALNPYVARYWLDLAAAYQTAGDETQQSRALEHALRAEPTAPDVAWEAANFYLVRNDLQRALPLYRVVIANDPSQVVPALELCWRATKSVDMVFQALPANPEPYFAFLNLLIGKNEAAPADAVWSKLINFTHQFPVQDAFPYLDYLIQNRRGDKAMQVWNQLPASNNSLQQYSEPGNLILNGGFENAFLNGGFDWRYQPKDQVEVALDTNEFHRGNRALRMVFKGPATPDTGIFEYVAVEPNSDYRFSAYTKAEDITSASGPRIAIQDAYSSESYVLTDDSLGTSGWRQQSGDFKTGPQTNMLAVKIVRVPGNALIKGTFWVDDLRLIKR